MKNYNNHIKENWGSGENKDFNGEYIPSKKDLFHYVGYNLFDMEDVWDHSKVIPKNSIEDYISLDTIKTMFPAYNDINFFNDWSTKVYLYKDNLIIYRSGYNYDFKKKIKQ